MSKKRRLPEKQFTQLNEDARKARRELDKKVFRRKDGVLQCPTVYAYGCGWGRDCDTALIGNCFK